MPKSTREIVKEMKDRKGLSFTQIGKLLGFSRQRAYQLYHGKHH